MRPWLCAHCKEGRPLVGPLDAAASMHVPSFVWPMPWPHALLWRGGLMMCVCQKSATSIWLLSARPHLAGAGNDYSKDLQFRKLNAQKDRIQIKVQLAGPSWGRGSLSPPCPDAPPPLRSRTHTCLAPRHEHSRWLTSMRPTCQPPCPCSQLRCPPAPFALGQVLRGGQQLLVENTELVVGDVLICDTGDKVRPVQRQPGGGGERLDVGEAAGEHACRLNAARCGAPLACAGWRHVPFHLQTRTARCSQAGSWDGPGCLA